MSKIDYQSLREAAEAIKVVATPQKLLAFRMKVTPHVVLALLDERDKWQQESSAWQSVAEKQLALAEAAEKRIAELESALNRHYESPDVYDMAIKQFESLAKS